MEPTRKTAHLLRLAPGALLIAGLAAPASAQIPSALLVEDGPIPGGPMGETISGINNTAVNHVGGYAVSISSTGSGSTLSHVWGNATGAAGTVLRSEGTIGDLVQNSFESFFGISDSGAICYSASTDNTMTGSTGLDGVWVDDTVVANEENAVTSLPGRFWTFGSRPGITADGTPYWIGGTTDTQGGSTQLRGLFTGFGQTVLANGGDVLPGLPAALSDSNGIDFDFRFSADGSNVITPVDLDTGSTTDDGAMTLNLAALLIDGSLVQESTPVPAAAGGLPGENWDNFDFSGITNGGSYFFTGDTDGDTGTDEFIVQDGAITYREGDIVDGFEISGSIEGAFINENADLAFIWDVEDPMLGNVEALYLNGELLLKEGDEVDLDGDGMIDPGAVLSQFTGISSLTLSDRAVDGLVRIYFTADVDTMGTSSTTDDVEGFFCLPVQLPECYLLFGTTGGGSAFNPGGGHTFWTQVGDVDGFTPVLLDNIGEIALPTSRLAFQGDAPLGRTLPLPLAGMPGGFGPQANAVTVITAQVVMWNPGVFPQQPEQYSYPISVIVRGDGTVESRRFGVGTGMDLWVETGLNEAGQPVLRFPFSIPGF